MLCVASRLRIRRMINELKIEDRIEDHGELEMRGTRKDVPISAHPALRLKVARGRFTK